MICYLNNSYLNNSYPIISYLNNKKIANKYKLQFQKRFFNLLEHKSIKTTENFNLFNPNKPISLNSPGLNSSGRALQRNSHHPLDDQPIGLHVHSGQRGDLRDMPSQAGHRASDLHEPQPADQPSRVLDHRFAALRRRAQRRPSRVPDEPRALSSHPLSPRFIRARSVREQRLPRGHERQRDHSRVLRAWQSDGQVRSQRRQIHGVLFAVQGRCGAEGCQSRDRGDEE